MAGRHHEHSGQLRSLDPGSDGCTVAQSFGRYGGGRSIFRVVLSRAPLWARSQRTPWKVLQETGEGSRRVIRCRTLIESDGFLRLRFARLSACASLRMTGVRDASPITG